MFQDIQIFVLRQNGATQLEPLPTDVRANWNISISSSSRTEATRTTSNSVSALHSFKLKWGGHKAWWKAKRPPQPAMVVLSKFFHLNHKIPNSTLSKALLKRQTSSHRVKGINCDWLEYLCLWHEMHNKSVAISDFVIHFWNYSTDIV